jgi:hypothetical protein
LLEALRRSSLRWIVTGAEPVPLALIDQLPDASTRRAVRQAARSDRTSS